MCQNAVEFSERQSVMATQLEFARTKYRYSEADLDQQGEEPSQATPSSTTTPFMVSSLQLLHLKMYFVI